MNKLAAASILVGAGLGALVGLTTGNLPVWLGVGAGVGMLFAFLAARGETARS